MTDAWVNEHDLETPDPVQVRFGITYLESDPATARAVMTMSMPSYRNPFTGTATVGPHVAMIESAGVRVGCVESGQDVDHQDADLHRPGTRLPVGSPETLIIPDIAWKTPSYPGLLAYGPSCPKPVSEQYPGMTERVRGLVGPIAKGWFRSEVRGLDTFPAGGALVVSNHSGGLIGQLTSQSWRSISTTRSALSAPCSLSVMICRSTAHRRTSSRARNSFATLAPTLRPLFAPEVSSSSFRVGTTTRTARPRAPHHGRRSDS